MAITAKHEKTAPDRLNNQQIAQHQFKRPDELVAWLGAIQAQDFAGAKWSIGLRLPEMTDTSIEKAISDRTIIRTWPMRGTLHFVAAADIHWMRALLTPRVIAGSASRQKSLELDAAVFACCEKLFLKALRGGNSLSRGGMLALLERERISTAGQRGYHILWRLAQEGLLCFGSHEGNQPTFALLDEWCPAPKCRDREESLAELTKRYFTSHGPATLDDFVWWSGLKVSDAKAGLSMVGTGLAQTVIDGKSYWMALERSSPSTYEARAYVLPGFDEYILGYKDRSAVLDRDYAERICPGFNGMFIPSVVLGGQIAGTWKRNLKKDAVFITPNPFVSFTKADKEAIAVAAEHFGKFLGKAVRVML
jgi:hypothetical protein